MLYLFKPRPPPKSLSNSDLFHISSFVFCKMLYNWNYTISITQICFFHLVIRICFTYVFLQPDGLFSYCMDVRSLSIPLSKSILLFFQFGVIINKTILNTDMDIYVRIYAFKSMDKADIFPQRYFKIMEISKETN